MILEIFFSTVEIRLFFEANGFEVVKYTFEKPVPAYHNRIEFTEKEADAVVINGQYIEAEKLFKSVALSGLKNMIAPPDGSLKYTIKTTFKMIIDNEK